MEGLTEGRIIHYVLPDGPSKGQHRPAIIVKVWAQVPNYPVNLQVFTDSDKDGKYNDQCDPVLWATSRTFDDGEMVPGTWHWIERS